MNKKRMQILKIRTAVEWILLLSFFTLSIMLVLIGIFPYKIEGAARRFPGIYMASIGIFLCLLAILISLLKVYYSYIIASKAARSESAKRYYDNRDNTQEHNNFLDKRTRKDLTYKDDHTENLSRQYRRWVLWVILALALCISLLLSVICRSFPVFLFLGFLEIIVFMYADYFPANKQYYMDFDLVLNSNNEEKVSYREAKAAFYLEEYEETGLDINDKKYRELYRNLFTIKEDIASFVNENKTSYPKLNFRPDEIRHIYKMCFDRIRNGQLVVNIVLTLVLILVIGLDFSSYSPLLVQYFMIPEMARLIITIISIIGVFLASIGQILRMPTAESIVAEISYKSRYIVDDRLNNLFVEDIVDPRGIIKPIDMARGIYQAQGYMMTADENGRVSGRDRILDWYDRPLFHHQEFSNRRRLVITVYLLMGSGISAIWYLGLWYLLPLIVACAVLSHFLLQRYLLPNLGKEKLKRDIEKLIKLKRSTE